MALCTDPAVTYLRGFGFNVVRLPRASILPLDLLGQADGPLIRLGPLSDVWKTEKAEPKAHRDETVDIKAQTSAKLKLSIGVRVLDSILQGLTGTPVGGGLDGAFENADGIVLSFDKPDVLGLTHIVLFGSKSHQRVKSALQSYSARFRLKYESKWLIKDKNTGKEYAITDPAKHEPGTKEREYAQQTDYGLIERFEAPMGRVYIIIAGLGGRATKACGLYLQKNWEPLLRDFGSGRFQVLLEVPPGLEEARVVLREPSLGAKDAAGTRPGGLPPEEAGAGAPAATPEYPDAKDADAAEAKPEKVKSTKAKSKNVKPETAKSEKVNPEKPKLAQKARAKSGKQSRQPRRQARSR